MSEKVFDNIYLYSLINYICFVVLNYGTDIFVTKNIVSDNIYEAGYFALSASHLALAFLFLLLGCSLSFTVFIAELVYGRLLGHTKHSDL
jgi:hypothetical protein